MMDQKRRAMLPSLLVASALLLLLTDTSLGFVAAVQRSPDVLGRHERTVARLRGGAASAPRMSRSAVGESGIDYSDPVTGATAFAIVGGILTGIAISKFFDDLSKESQISESMAAKLSADAGMEDVEDDESENIKARDLIESMRKAQGLDPLPSAAPKEKKESVDDGW
mmetsp:Transcript_103039/g.204527  ORF Transcript_103039/g.204527 Transcript_103039/m.204527 type:complete len:168 (-) Transcript_103039:149-652(-)